MVEINVEIRCLDGQAPKEQDVEIMYNHLDAYAARRYPDLKVISERQYWANILCTDDMRFMIFGSLEKW